MQLIGIQGDVGSAAEMAACKFCESEAFDSPDFIYLVTAQAVVEALSEKRIGYGVLALESPLGSPLLETSKALERRTLEVSAQADLPVNHALLGRTLLPFERYESIISHPVALAKHKSFLTQRFPFARLIASSDTGSAARELAEGALSDKSLVIAMPRAAESLGLEIILDSLPGNDGYLTRFVLLKSL